MRRAAKTDARYPYSWEQAIEVLRNDPLHQQLIFDAYLSRDLLRNCERFLASEEFAEVLRILARLRAGKDLLDVPAGNGIATYAFVKSGYRVTAVDPDPSKSLGRGAIAHVLESSGLLAKIVDAFGENLPFSGESVDVVYVRQGLHHAADLNAMLREFYRVLRPSGVLLACREHVVDDYDASLQTFLDAQADHQLYGGENAFMLSDYRAAFDGAGFAMLSVMDPWDSVINLAPDTPSALRARLLSSRPGRLLRSVMPEQAVVQLGLLYLRRRKVPGRLYSFVARKPAS